MQKSAFFLEPFDDAAALVDLPGITALEQYLREPLDIVEQDVSFSAVQRPCCSPRVQPDIQSVASWNSSTSSSGRACTTPSVAADADVQCVPRVPLPASAFAPSLDRSSSPDVLEVAAGTAGSASLPDIPAPAKVQQNALQDVSEPESVKVAPAPRPRERKRRQHSTFTVSKLAKQREKNRRCQRSFRERQKVKQEAQLQELQDLKDRCAWLESQLALQQAAAGK